MPNKSQIEHYVTLMDSNFLPQGLALYESMVEHAKPFVLWVQCVDEKARHVLERLSKPGIHPLSISEIETPQLLQVKKQRTIREYCWTLKPMTPKIVLDRDQTINRVSYLDADLWFLKSPSSLFEEFEESGRSILITDHGYDSENDRSLTSGRYCAQFMTFVREKSEPVRQWWEARCLEWCFARREKGLFADQKYLDDWPSRFSKDVHVLKQLDLFLAPWNARRFHYSRGAVWHFHGLRLLKGGRVKLHPGYSISKDVEQNVYGPYVNSLHRAVQEIGEPIVQRSSSNLSHIIPSQIRNLVRRGLQMAASLRRV